MRVILAFHVVFVGLILGTSGQQALGDDKNVGGQLVHVRFDRLIPISYPTIQSNFDHLRPTTIPLIHPETPQVPITEDLAQSFARPLLITTG